MIKFSKKRIMEIGICLLVFLLPWQTRLILHRGTINGNPAELLTLSIYGVDILLLVLLCWKIYATDGVTFPKKEKAEKYFLYAALSFFIWILVSIFFSFDKTLATQRAAWFLGAALFSWIVAASKNKIGLLYCFIAGLTLSAWLAITQFIFQYTFAFKWLGLAIHNPTYGGTSIVELYSFNGSPIRWLRAYGTFDHPNVLGGAMAIGILFVLWLLAKKTKAKWKNNLLYVALFSMSVGLFTSLSRSAWVGLFLALAILFIFSIVKKQKELRGNITKPVILVVITFIIFTLIYPAQFMMRSGGQGRLEQKSIDDRGLYLQQGESIIKENLILGTGTGNYIEALLQKNTQDDAWNYQPVHNVFLYIWAELGIVGLALAVTMLYFLGILAWRNGIFIFATLISLIPSLLLDHWLWDLHFGILLFGLIVGLILNKTE